MKIIATVRMGSVTAVATQDADEDWIAYIGTGTPNFVARYGHKLQQKEAEAIFTSQTLTKDLDAHLDSLLLAWLKGADSHTAQAELIEEGYLQAILTFRGRNRVKRLTRSSKGETEG